MKVSAIIIDDEQNNIDNLVSLLKKHCPDVTVVGSALSADEGKALINEYDPDLIFLDIQMPGKNGFDLLKSLSDYSFEVIFVTAHDKYGIQAVKFSALEYLLKPINIPELQSAVQKAVAKTTVKKSNLRLENLIKHLKQNREKH